MEGLDESRVIRRLSVEENLALAEKAANSQVMRVVEQNPTFNSLKKRKIKGNGMFSIRKSRDNSSQA